MGILQFSTYSIIKGDSKEIMACTNNKNRNYKSCLQTYNNTAQTVTATATTLNILGTTCTDTGCAITATTNSANVNCDGLYEISATVTFTANAAGVEVIQLYNGSTALPCAISQATVASGGVYTIPVSTKLQFSPCINSVPSINVKASGVAGVVNWIGFSIVKLA